MTESKKREIRNSTNTYYDMQKLRIMTGNRIITQIYAKLGLEAIPDEPPESASEAEKKAWKEKSTKRKEKAFEFCQALDIMPAEGSASGFDFLEYIVKYYRCLTDMFGERHATIAKKLAEIGGPGVITDEGEMILVSSYMDLLRIEADLIKGIEISLEGHPVWDEYLSKIPGIGPKTAGMLLSYLRLEDAPHPSSFVKYAIGCPIDFIDMRKTIIDENGKEIPNPDYKKKVLDDIVDEREFINDEFGNPCPNPNYGKPMYRREAMGKKEYHLVEKEYQDRNGKVVKTRGLGYNPKLRTMLLGVMSGNLLKVRQKTDEVDENGKIIRLPHYYGQIYYGYRNRLDNSPRHDGKSNAHKNRMALRYMVEKFLIDLHIAWRLLEGKAPSIPYEQDKLGLTHSRTSPYLVPLYERFGYADRIQRREYDTEIENLPSDESEMKYSS